FDARAGRSHQPCDRERELPCPARVDDSDGGDGRDDQPPRLAAPLPSRRDEIQNGKLRSSRSGYRPRRAAWPWRPSPPEIYALLTSFAPNSKVRALPPAEA